MYPPATIADMLLGILVILLVWPDFDTPWTL